MFVFDNKMSPTMCDNRNCKMLADQNVFVKRVKNKDQSEDSDDFDPYTTATIFIFLYFVFTNSLLSMTKRMSLPHRNAER